MSEETGEDRKRRLAWERKRRQRLTASEDKTFNELTNKGYRGNL